MLEQEIFFHNLQRWSLFCPIESTHMVTVECHRIFFTQSANGAPNLLLQYDSRTEYLHSQENPLEEANKWKDQLALKGTKLLYVYGVGLGYAYDALKNWLTEGNFLVFLEDDLEVLHRLFETERGKEILQDKQVRIQFFTWDEPSDIVWKKLGRLFWKYPFHLAALPFYEKSNPEAVAQLHAKLFYWHEMSRAMLLEYMQFGVHFYTNYYQNLKELPISYHGNALFEQFTNIPAIICGAGPSLDKNLPLLKTVMDRALIFAGGSAMNVLNGSGLSPHFGLGIDPNEAQNARIQMNTAYDVPFFYRGRMNHFALKSIHGPKIYINGSEGYRISNWFEESLGIVGKNVQEGFNVVNFSIALACELGCNPIIFVGLDLAYTNDQSYSQGIVEHPLYKKILTKKADEELLVKSDIYGEPTQTLWKWISESSWIGQFALSKPEKSFINATEGGIGISNITNMTLNEAISRLLQKQYDMQLLVHGELQSQLMPEQVTSEKIQQQAALMSNSLARCIENIKDHQEEIGYKYILEDFASYYTETVALDFQQLEYDPSLSSEDRIKQKELLEDSSDLFLKEAAKINKELLQRNILNETDNPNETKQSQKREYIYQEGELYQFENQRIKIDDQVLQIKYEDPETTILNEVKTLYADGSVKMIHYESKGLLHGPAYYYNQSNNLLGKSWHVLGKREGILLLYYNTASLYSVQRFRQGVSEGQQLYYYPNGQLKSDVTYSQGQLNGTVFLYYNSGQIKREIQFVQGKRMGFERYWYPSGQMKMEVAYFQDRPVGVVRAWHSNGILAKEVTYDPSSKFLSSKAWNAEGNAIEEKEEKDYFEQVVQQTDHLTHTFGDLFKHLKGIESQGDLKELWDEFERLQKITQAIQEEQIFQMLPQEETVMKTPTFQRELQKQMDVMTHSLKKEMGNLLSHVEDIKKNEQDKSS